MKYHYTVVHKFTGQVILDSRRRKEFDGYDSEIRAENAAIAARSDNDLPADILDIFTFPAGKLEEMSEIKI